MHCKFKCTYKAWVKDLKIINNKKQQFYCRRNSMSLPMRTRVKTNCFIWGPKFFLRLFDSFLLKVFTSYNVAIQCEMQENIIKQ